LRITPKKIFVDPSLAIAALKLTESYILKNLNFFGFIFENLVLRDLLVYAQAKNKNYQISFYRDNKDLEIDVIVSGDDNHYGAIEIKLGSSDIQKAEENLLTFSAKMLREGNKKPSFLAIIVGIGGVLQRKENGIYIIPYDCLGV
jgi:predicted AAA+ superfamily ATPase